MSTAKPMPNLRLCGSTIEADLLLDRLEIRIAASATEVIVQVPGQEADARTVHAVDLPRAVALAMKILVERHARGYITGQMNMLAATVLILTRALQ